MEEAREELRADIAATLRRDRRDREIVNTHIDDELHAGFSGWIGWIRRLRRSRDARGQTRFDVLSSECNRHRPDSFHQSSFILLLSPQL